MPTALDRVRDAVETLTDFGQRSAATLSARVRRVRASLLIAIQASVAAGIAWFVAHDLIGHKAPFFAPVSAVIVLGVSVGQRLRRAFELVLGVALGIFVGDVLIYFIGAGGWQISFAVLLAIMAAVFVGGSATVIGQSASSAVLVATLAPPVNGIYYTRFIDALVGGVVGVLVMALLLPLNPLTTVQRAAGQALDLLASELTGAANAMESRDLSSAQDVLDRIRASEGKIAGFREALGVAGETVSIAPVRWRARAPLAQYVDGAVHIDRAIRNGRVLARRTVSMVREDEPVPADLPSSVRVLAEAVTQLRRELAGGVQPKRARELAVSAAAQAAEAYRSGLGFSGNVVVAQIRSIATDLLRGTGLDEATSLRAMRRAVGRLAT